MATNALIVGAGRGISASFARTLAREGAKVMLASRSPEKVADIAAEIGARAVQCDASDQASVEALFDVADSELGDLDLVLYNVSYRVRGPFLELDPAKVEKTLIVSAHGGFLVGQQAAKRMVARGSGAIFFTGASASVKGYSQSAPFAMGKFALRGLAQSMARDLAPKGIHVAHFVIDGGVRSAERDGRVEGPGDTPDKWLDPDAIAQTYMSVFQQSRSAWSQEVEVRPWVEQF